MLWRLLGTLLLCNLLSTRNLLHAEVCDLLHTPPRGLNDRHTCLVPVLYCILCTAVCSFYYILRHLAIMFSALSVCRKIYEGSSVAAEGGACRGAGRELPSTAGHACVCAANYILRYLAVMLSAPSVCRMIYSSEGCSVAEGEVRSRTEGEVRVANCRAQCMCVCVSSTAEHVSRTDEDGHGRAGDWRGVSSAFLFFWAARTCCTSQHFFLYRVQVRKICQNSPEYDGKQEKKGENCQSEAVFFQG